MLYNQGFKNPSAAFPLESLTSFKSDTIAAKVGVAALVPLSTPNQVQVSSRWLPKLQYHMRAPKTIDDYLKITREGTDVREGSAIGVEISGGRKIWLL